MQCDADLTGLKNLTIEALDNTIKNTTSSEVGDEEGYQKAVVSIRVLSLSKKFGEKALSWMKKWQCRRITGGRLLPWWQTNITGQNRRFAEVVLRMTWSSMPKREMLIAE